MKRLLIYTTCLFLLTILIVPSLLHAERKDPIICDLCKDTIKTQYIEFEGKYYHPIHFQCDNCGTVLGNISYYIKDGHKYCKKCYLGLFADRCDYCGEPIDGNAIIADGKTYHQFCYNNHVSPKCAATGFPLKGKYLQDYWGNKYHISCQDNLDQCYYCLRFISENTTGGGIEYEDGRHVCNLCLETAINDIGEAKRLLEDTRDRLAIAGIYITEKISLHLVDLIQLQEIAGPKMKDPAGYAKCEIPLDDSQDRIGKFDIYLLSGMPRLDFINTAAHEMMHVWQFKYGRQFNDFDLCEGSCNFASYLVLSQFDDPYAIFLRQNIEMGEHEYYGEGFRRVSKYVDDNDIGGWLNLLKESDSFPSGY